MVNHRFLDIPTLHKPSSGRVAGSWIPPKHLGCGYGVHHAVEDYGLHRDLDPGCGREAQHILFSSLDAIYVGERTSAGTVRSRCRPHAVAHLVADKGHGAREQHRDQHLVSVDARWRGLVVLIHHLGYDEVFEEVHAPVLLTLGGDSSGLGCRVHLESLPAPGPLDASPRLFGEDLGAGEDEAWGDA